MVLHSYWTLALREVHLSPKKLLSQLSEKILINLADVVKVSWEKTLKGTSKSSYHEITLALKDSVGLGEERALRLVARAKKGGRTDVTHDGNTSRAYISPRTRADASGVVCVTFSGSTPSNPASVHCSNSACKDTICWHMVRVLYIGRIGIKAAVPALIKMRGQETCTSLSASNLHAANGRKSQALGEKPGTKIAKRKRGGHSRPKSADLEPSIFCAARDLPSVVNEFEETDFDSEVHKQVVEEAEPPKKKASVSAAAPSPKKSTAESIIRLHGIPPESPAWNTSLKFFQKRRNIGQLFYSPCTQFLKGTRKPSCVHCKAEIEFDEERIFTVKLEDIPGCQSDYQSRMVKIVTHVSCFEEKQFSLPGRTPYTRGDKLKTLWTKLTLIGMTKFKAAADRVQLDPEVSQLAK